MNIDDVDERRIPVSAQLGRQSTGLGGRFLAQVADDDTDITAEF
jgi:hypothetical protein